MAVPKIGKGAACSSFSVGFSTGRGKFDHRDTRRRRRSEGSGLGLAIARSIAVARGGLARYLAPRSLELPVAYRSKVLYGLANPLIWRRGNGDCVSAAREASDESEQNA